MLSGNCTKALSTNVTISGSSAKLIKNGIAPLPFPLPALLKQYWYIKRGERVTCLPRRLRRRQGVRGHALFYATLRLSCPGRFDPLKGLPSKSNSSMLGDVRPLDGSARILQSALRESPLISVVLPTFNR